MDGTIFHLGRKDHQVKIRGQCVEFVEVERQVKDCFDEDAAHVIAEVITPKERSNPLLAAFVYQRDENTQDQMAAASELLRKPSPDFIKQAKSVRSRLIEAMPSAMIPAIFIPLFPTTMAGKTGRKLLRETAAALSFRSSRNEYMKALKMKRAFQRPPSG